MNTNDPEEALRKLLIDKIQAGQAERVDIVLDRSGSSLEQLNAEFDANFRDLVIDRLQPTVRQASNTFTREITVLHRGERTVLYRPNGDGY